MAGGATLTRKFTASTDPARLPSVLMARLICPKCDLDLGRDARVVLESAWSASTRPAAAEAVIVCPGCDQLFVAVLALAPANRGATGSAAAP
jgi:hypothetical protein